jgi:chemotaxis protein methyltransferase CheR
MVDTQTYEFYRDFLFAKSGYVLSEDKKYLLDSKLSPVADKHQIENVIELARKLERLPTLTMTQDVVDAMTINETFFFRDQRPFELLEKVIRDDYIKHQDRTNLKFWSAACSSGQEAYSIAMTVEKVMKTTRPIDYKITGSDISTEIVQRATQGIYNDFEVKRGLTDAQISENFEKKPDGWHISNHLKRHTQFRIGNLVTDFYTDGPFDIIFLRNVLIYFDMDTKKRILEKMHRVLAPEGYLVLGAAETVMGLGDYFSPVSDLRGFYHPNN